MVNFELVFLLMMMVIPDVILDALCHNSIKKHIRDDIVVAIGNFAFCKSPLAFHLLHDVAKIDNYVIFAYL